MMYLVFRRMGLTRKTPTEQTRHWLEAHRGALSEGEGDESDVITTARGADFSGNRSVPFDMSGT